MSQPNPLSVLLVDDDRDSRNLFEMVMTHHHFRFASVDNAEAALDYLAENTPDVIVLDIYLPGIDGFKALKEIRQRQLAPNTSIVATTAYYNTDTPTDIRARGFDGYLQKPFNPQTLAPYLTQIASQD